MDPITICTFVILYLSDADGLPAQMRQNCQTCAECSALEAAYTESGPPHWLKYQVIMVGCERREEWARPT